MKDISKRWNEKMENNGISVTKRECIVEGSNKFSKKTNPTNGQHDELKRNDSYLLKSTLCKKMQLLSINGKLSVQNGIIL